MVCMVCLLLLAALLNVGAVVRAGMQVLSNLGRDYTSRFRVMFSEPAATNDAVLMPFLLEGVAGNPALNLPDGMHPAPAGHTIIAEHVWQVLEPVLRSLQ